MDEINKIRKLKIIGIIFSVTLILLSIFVLGGQGLLNSRQNVVQYFYEIENEFSIQSQLSFIWGQGQNMLLIAERNLQADSAPLAQALMILQDIADSNISNDFALRYQLKNNVVYEISQLANSPGFAAEDEALTRAIESDVLSAVFITQNSSFNSLASEFNAGTLQQFPANIIAAVRGINNIELFE
ncbi:MAG: hypothetical protein FWG63_07285 [Defluviitaleaceae bacterium]|nr:hypothetical protein [Defluviitaleaceae bacterium]